MIAGKALISGLNSGYTSAYLTSPSRYHVKLIKKTEDLGYDFLSARTTLHHYYIGYACPKDLLSLGVIKDFLKKRTDLSSLIGLYGAARDDMCFWEAFHDELKEIIYSDKEYKENYAPPKDKNEFDLYYRMEPLYKRGIKYLRIDHNYSLPSDLNYDLLFVQLTGITAAQARRYLERLSKNGYVITNMYELSSPLGRWQGILDSGLLKPVLIHVKHFHRCQDHCGNRADGFNIIKERIITVPAEILKYFSSRVSASDTILLQKQSPGPG